MGWSPHCYIPSVMEIGLLVPEKNIFDWFLKYMGHLGHVTSIMSSDFHFLVPLGLPVPEKKIFKGFFPYMGMAAILVM